MARDNGKTTPPIYIVAADRKRLEYLAKLENRALSGQLTQLLDEAYELRGLSAAPDPDADKTDS